MNAVAPSIAMLAAIALTIGGVVVVRRKADRTRGILMLVMAMVLVGNVAIWTV